MQNHILSIILFTPLLGAIVLLFVPKENKDAIRWIANIFALGGLLISLPLIPMRAENRYQKADVASGCLDADQVSQCGRRLLGRQPTLFL